MSSLFDLNDRIFAAMDELDAANDENIEQAIEKAKVKTQLFATAINNANTMSRIASMQEQTMDGLALKVGTSKDQLRPGQPGRGASRLVGSHSARGLGVQRPRDP